MNVQEGRGGGGGGGGEVSNQPQLQLPPPPPPPPPQRCPRCDSVNTKFCYYNNYSLSQPRYFCKTCKRYWTHGGSLRNIPIGGGCRKGKRMKASSSASSSSSAALQMMSRPQQLQQPRLQEVIPTQPNLMMSPPHVLLGRSSAAAAAAAPPPVVPSISSNYQGGGGYLSSLAAIHSQNPLSQPFYDLSSLNLGPSNLGIHPRFNNNAPSSTTQASKRHIPPPLPVVLQSANRSRDVESLYASDHQGLVQTSMMMMNMGNSNFSSLHDWSQNSLWSTVSTTSIGDISGNTNNDDNGNDNNAKAGSSSSPSGNQWPDDDLPAGFGPPP